MNKNIKFTLPIGSASVLLIFVSLALVSFSILSFQSANADLKLTNKAANYTSKYYESVHMANAYLAEKDSELKRIYDESSSSDEYMEKASKYTLEEYFEINDLQTLHVAIQIVYPDANKIAAAKNKSTATKLESANYNASVYYKITAFNVETGEDLIEYDDNHIPIYGK